MEWAVVRAVSDFADGSKEKTEHWQPFASAMAASVVYNMFKYSVVLKDWRHYKPDGEEGIVKHNFGIILSSNLEKL
jgi:hypothetical protein